MSEPQTGRPGPYAPRRYRFAGLWQTAGWRLKAYGIEADEAAAPLSVGILGGAAGLLVPDGGGPSRFSTLL